MKKPVINEIFADNGEHSHWQLIDDDGVVLWSEDPDEDRARGMIRELRPSNFLKFPMGSILQNHEYETIARNIMKILNRTGNRFRPLSWDEYLAERTKDGNSSIAEKMYFLRVVDYCISENTAKLFCSDWAEI